MARQERLIAGFTVVIDDVARSILITDSHDDCPYEMGAPKWESTVWQRCMAKRMGSVTTIGEPDVTEDTTS